jgi:hypothetical protein
MSMTLIERLLRAERIEAMVSGSPIKGVVHKVASELYLLWEAGEWCKLLIVEDDATGDPIVNIEPASRPRPAANFGIDGPFGSVREDRLSYLNDAGRVVQIPQAFTLRSQFAQIVINIGSVSNVLFGLVLIEDSPAVTVPVY